MARDKREERDLRDVSDARRVGKAGLARRGRVRSSRNFEFRIVSVALFPPLSLVSLEYIDSLPTLCYPHYTRPVAGHFATIGW